MTPEQIKSSFDTIKARFDSNYGALRIKPDKDEIKQWTNVETDLDKIAELYKSGACGDKFRDAFGGAPLPPRPGGYLIGGR